jgi:hypothetical protein
MVSDGLVPMKEIEGETMLKKGQVLTKTRIRQVAELVGLTLDEEQVNILYEAEKKGELYVCAMRQFGKTIAAIMFLLIGALKGEECLYTAHNSDCVMNTMRKFVALSEPLIEPGIVKKISASHGFTQVEFAAGNLVKFRIRTGRMGVGTSLDRIVYDEAQMLEQATIEELEPTMTNSASGRTLLIGTPPTPAELASYGFETPWILARSEAGDRWVEYSLVPEYSKDIPVTVASIKKANPSWRRIPDLQEFVAKNRRKLGHEGFCRMYLGVWNLPSEIEMHEPYISVDEAKKFMTKAATSSSRFTAALGILPSSKKAFITMCDGGMSEVAAEFDMEIGGIDAIVDWVVKKKAIIESFRIPDNVRGRAIETALREKRCAAFVKMMKLPETDNQIARFLKQTKEGSLFVYESDKVWIAITSFWLGLIPQSGSHEILSGVPEDAALILSLVNATKDGRALERRSYKPIGR